MTWRVYEWTKVFDEFHWCFTGFEHYTRDQALEKVNWIREQYRIYRRGKTARFRIRRVGQSQAGAT